MNITFKDYDISHNVKQVMGFVNNKKTYDVVFFLVRKSKYTYVHGLLSKVSMISFYKDLWKYLQEIVKTSHIAFEVIKEHAFAYRAFLIIEEEYECETFDGFKSVLLCVNKDSNLRRNNVY